MIELIFFLILLSYFIFSNEMKSMGKNESPTLRVYIYFQNMNYIDEK